jgi:hypothetical protein
MPSRVTNAPVVTFPSIDWFQRLADVMNANRARHEKLGYVDCVAQFTVLDPGTSPWNAQVTFEEFSAVDVRQVEAGDEGRADFVLEMPLEQWRSMIDSIAAGEGRPALEQTLNCLSNMGAPLAVRSNDPLRRDLYFRYNQSLQEFINASAAFKTTYGRDS